MVAYRLLDLKVYHMVYHCRLPYRLPYMVYPVITDNFFAESRLEGVGGALPSVDIKSTKVFIRTALKNDNDMNIQIG